MGTLRLNILRKKKNLSIEQTKSLDLADKIRELLGSIPKAPEGYDALEIGTKIHKTIEELTDKPTMTGHGLCSVKPTYGFVNKTPNCPYKGINCEYCLTQSVRGNK